MINVRAKIEKSIRHRGVRATIRMSLYNLAYYAGKLSPSALYSAYKEREFDRAFGVDTAGRIDLSDLGDVHGPAAELGTRYEPIDPSYFGEVMHRALEVGIDPSALTFVDYGCGKGRALLLASHYPFKNIVGVEVSSKLSDTARRNLAAYSAPDRRCTQVSVETADALEWEPPDEPTLFYLYHPFEAELLGRVLERIHHSFVAHPRPGYLVYVGAMEEVLEQSDRLRTLAIQSDVDPRHGIYEWRRGEID